MKNIILILNLLFLSSISFAADVLMIIDRNEQGRAIKREHTFEGLQDGEFKNLDFKIVHGRSGQAISLRNESEDLKLKAATVLYHLHKAKNYFLTQMKSDYVKNLGQLTIRIDITDQYNEYAHFGNPNLPKKYNDALSIKGGSGLPRLNIAPWGREIWFRPSKKIHIKELTGVVDQSGDSYKAILKTFRNQMHMQTLQMFMSDLARGAMKNPGYGIDDIMRTAGASLMLEFGYHMVSPLTKLFSRKWYHLDSALVPEIIYHEFSHVALSDKLETLDSFPVNEGLADYFASQIANSSKLATKIKKYNTFNGKNAKRNQQYALQFENEDFANTDFVFGLLWNLKDIWGEDTACYLYELRGYVDPEASIRKELIQGLLDVSSIEKNCSKVGQVDTNATRVKLLMYLNHKGI